MGALFVSVSFLVGCAADQPDGSGSDQPTIESAAVVCETLQEINEVWFRTPSGDESPDDFVAAFRNLSARLAGEVSTWSGEADASIRSAAELVSQDLSVINAFNADAPDNVEESNKFIETLDSFEEGIGSALSLCRESGALESSETGSAGAANPIRFELTETVEVEALTSSQTSLWHLQRVPGGRFIMSDTPDFEDVMYIRYFDSETLAPLDNVMYDFNDRRFKQFSPDGLTFSFSKNGCGLVDVRTEKEAFFAGDGCFSSFSSDGTRFYMADNSGRPGSIRVISVETFQELDSILVTEGPGNIYATSGLIFTNLRPSGDTGEAGGTLVLDEVSGEVLFELPFPVEKIEASSDPHRFFLTSRDPSKLSMLDTQKLEVTELVQLPNIPDYTAVSPDGNLVAISNFGS